MRKFLMISAAALLLTACSNAEAGKAKSDTAKAAQAVKEAGHKEAAAGSDKTYAKERKFDGAKLKTILDAQPEKAQARFNSRNPAKTLKFFGIKPGMSVGEALPGGGWYTKILVPYLGEEAPMKLLWKIRKIGRLNLSPKPLNGLRRTAQKCQQQHLATRRAPMLEHWMQFCLRGFCITCRALKRKVNI